MFTGGEREGKGRSKEMGVGGEWRPKGGGGRGEERKRYEMEIER